MSKSKKRNIPAPPKPNMVTKPKLSHNSIYYKQEFAIMYAPVPMRTAITFRLFWWNKVSINVRAFVKMVVEVVKAKFKKAELGKADSVIDGNDIKTGTIKSDVKTNDKT